MRRTLVLAAVLPVAVLAGCSAGPGPVFDNEGYADVSCMRHQTDEPGARYTDSTQRNTAANLTLMKYYTHNGAKPYCDGQPANAKDRQWAQLYVSLGGPADKVPTALR